MPEPDSACELLVNAAGYSGVAGQRQAAGLGGPEPRRAAPTHAVTPAQAGVQLWTASDWKDSWIPAFAGMTG